MAVDMKVTNKKGAGFYARAIASFFKGVEAKEAEGDKPAVEAKVPVDVLTISGLGDAINVAVAAASKAEEDGIARISKIETGYPEMTGGRGCAQITIRMKKLEAPYLHKFYEIYSKKGLEVASQVQQALQANIFTVQEKMQQIQREQLEFYDNECKPLLRQSFAVHDKDGNGVLDAKEAELLFSHIVEEIHGLMIAQSGNQANTILEKLLGTFTPMLPGDGKTKEMFKDALTDMMMEVPPAIRKCLLNTVADYKTNKAARDADLFKMLDVNGDGKLQIDEFLVIWSPDGGMESNVMKLMRTLGFDDGKIMGGLIMEVRPSVIEIGGVLLDKDGVSRDDNAKAEAMAAIAQEFKMKLHDFKV